ncbi:MAG: mechanosensitive ion channel family protein [Burkholderiaceae bacterium]
MRALRTDWRPHQRGELWADLSVLVRARFNVAPLEQWTVRREFLRRLKFAFDDAGIQTPFPQLTLRRAAGSPVAHGKSTELGSASSGAR